MTSRATRWISTVSKLEWVSVPSPHCHGLAGTRIRTLSIGSCTGTDHPTRYQHKYLTRNYSHSQSLSLSIPSPGNSPSTPGIDSTTTTAATSTTAISTGEEIYQQAMQAMEAVHLLRQQKEDERSAKMYEAWEKAKNADKCPKDQGIKVIKTLAKETRKERNHQHDQVNQEKQSYQRAMELLEQAAFQHDHPMALIQLGNMALERAGSADLQQFPDQRKEQIETAIQLFQKAGLAGSRVGWYNLGHLYWTGYPSIPVDDDDDENDGHDNDNCHDHHHHHHHHDHDHDHGNHTHGTLVVPPQPEQILQPDLHQAMDAFGKAIDLGDTDAMYLVGVHRMTEGGRENIHSGLKLVERAGNEGHGGALYYLALLHLNGEPTIGLEPCTEREFMQRLDRAVDAGNVDAMFTRGHSYYHGTEGYPQNYPRALNDFLQATEQGHADSAVSAGAMLHAGMGVPKDQERAFELYQTAGELGSIEGWKNVVACYLTGEGVPQSLETARYISETMLQEKRVDR